MGNIYDVDIKRLIKLLLPMRWRNAGLLTLIRALTEPIAGLPVEVKNYKAKQEYRMSYNGQVCRLRGLLNDEFDAEERRITIVDAKGDDANRYLFVYARGDGQNVLLPRMVRERHSPSLDKWDFEISVPTELKIEELRIKALINEYKLASKRYKINYI